MDRAISEGAMAMGPEKGQAATRQIEMMVCLDELVPAEDPYRVLDRLVDWSFVRQQAAPYYAGEGRPSIDPTVLVKLMLAGALEGIGSMRELLRVAALRLDLRRFLGYGLSERLPVHQTLSHAQTRRFVDGALFERLFTRTVALCREHDLLDGTHLSIDGFHVEANAALASLRASLSEAEASDAPAPATPAPEPAPGQLALVPAPTSAAPPRGRRSSNATAISRTDPDARLRHKPGQRPRLVFRGQVAVDPKRRCVAACGGEQATGHEGDALAPLVDRARFTAPALRSIGADCGFAAERVYAELERRQLDAFVPPQPNMLPRGDTPQTESQRLALAARRRCKSAEGIWAHARRMADAEGVISELKTQGTLARARCCGRSLFHVQVLIDCAAVNCKRLIEHAPGAAEGLAAGGHDTHAASRMPGFTPCAALGGPPAPAGAVKAWVGHAAWAFTVSLN